MSSRCYQALVCALILFLCLYISKSNDEAVNLGLRKVDLSSDMNGWTTASQSKSIEYGEWRTSWVNSPGGAWGGVVDNVTTLVWEDFKTVRSNEFQRVVLGNGEHGLRIQSITPFVPGNATNYTQQEVNSFLVSPRIDLSRSAQDHLIFQYKSNPSFNLEVWIGKNDGTLWNGIWEQGQAANSNNAISRTAEGGFTEVTIDLENSVLDVNKWLNANGFPDSVISPQTDEIFITIVAKDVASRWLGTSVETLEIKSIWTPSYYGDEESNQELIEPMIVLNHKLETVTFSGSIGKTYEVEISNNLKEWSASHSFTLASDSETYPISYFLQKKPTRSFFRLKQQQP